MKLTFLLTTADTMGGTERAVFTLANLLAAEHQVEVLSVFRTATTPFFGDDSRVPVRYLVDSTGSHQRPVRETEQDQATLKRLAALPSQIVDRSWESIFNRLSDVELRAALSTIDTDIVISTTPALMAVAVELAPPHVLTIHQEHRVSELRGSSGGPLLPLAPRLDALAALTERTRLWFAESLGAAAPSLVTLGNPVPDEYRPLSTRESQTVVIAGRLVTEKQVDHAVEAFARIADKHPDWSLRVLGSGPTLKPVRERAAQLGIADQVHCVGNSPAMAEEWAKASLALLTSRTEAFPLVLLEALAAGVPVVAYDCPNGPGEIISDGEDGLLVPLGDIDGLAAALDRLMSDHALRHSFGETALRNVARFSPETVFRGWNELFTRLIEERDSGRRLQRRAERQMVAAATAVLGDPVAAQPLPAGAGRVDQKAQEVRIEALHGGSVVRAGGQICTVEDEQSPWEVMDANLALTVDSLERRDIPYALVRTAAMRHSVAVPARHRQAVLTALVEDYRDRPVYTQLLDARGGVSATLLTAVLADKAPGAVPALRVFAPTVTSSGGIRRGGVYGCQVLFWEPEQSSDAPASAGIEEPEPTGEAVPMTTPLVGGTVFGPSLPLSVFERPASREVAGRSYATVEAFQATMLDDVDFPIDAVYTWVDSTDPKWSARRDEFLTSQGLAPRGSAAGDARFRNRDELRYSLRSLDMHAPWIRHVYLVTDDQTPAWLDTEHPRVTVVPHRELFGDTGRLPSYNSHAIESRLHRIEGLSEHFLYLNDDFFFGRAVTPEHFFQGNGCSRFFRSGTPVPPGEPVDGEDFFLIAAKNNRALLERDFGRTPAHAFLHTPYALRRSVLEDIERRYPQEVARTAAAQLRSGTDLSIASSLHHNFGFLTGRSVPGRLSCGFVNVGLREQHSKLSRMLSVRNHDVFCLNDFHDGDVPEDEQAEIIALFLASYFPTPSQFESGAPRNIRLRGTASPVSAAS